MSQRLSTAGMFLCWASETSAGTMPTSGYTIVPEVKSIPSFNPTPEAIQSTTLLETEFHTYVEGLKDLGGTLEFGANLTEDLITAWASVNTAHDSAASASPAKGFWFAVCHPKLAKSVVFKGDPAPLGLNEATVNAMAETTLYITPNSAPKWETITQPTVTATVLGG